MIIENSEGNECSRNRSGQSTLEQFRMTLSISRLQRVQSKLLILAKFQHVSTSALLWFGTRGEGRRSGRGLVMICRHDDWNLVPSLRTGVRGGSRCLRRFRRVIRSTSDLTALCTVFVNALRTREAQLRLQKPSKTVSWGVGLLIANIKQPLVPRDVADGA
jgi:hypothetical protein